MLFVVVASFAWVDVNGSKFAEALEAQCTNQYSWRGSFPTCPSLLLKEKHNYANILSVSCRTHLLCEYITF